MRDLIGFIYRYSSWLLFLIYVVLSCWLLAANVPYHRHLWLTSAGAVASAVYDAGNNVTAYFYLREVNDNLQHQNGELEAEVAALRHQLRLMNEKLYADTMTVDAPYKPFRFIVASVTNNSIAMPHNHLTLNKGYEDGVRPEMGVVDPKGVVGIVSAVGPRHASVISMLNPDFRLSCKVKGNDAFGSLVWDGLQPDQAVLEELPRHAVYMPGDTIVTSGYSAVFPEGIPIGTVMEASRDQDDNFFNLRIKLFTDFARLSTVRIIVNNDSAQNLNLPPV